MFDKLLALAMTGLLTAFGTAILSTVSIVQDWNGVLIWLDAQSP
jgi:hypothetical protein